MQHVFNLFGWAIIAILAVIIIGAVTGDLTGRAVIFYRRKRGLIPRRECRNPRCTVHRLR